MGQGLPESAGIGLALSTHREGTHSAIAEQLGDHRSWATLRRVLGTHCYTTIVLPTTSGKVHRLRVPGDPDQAQAQIYTALGINWKDLPRYHTTA